MNTLKKFVLRLQGKKPFKGYIAICEFCKNKHVSPTDSINDAVLPIKHSPDCPYEHGANMKPICYRAEVWV